MLTSRINFGQRYLHPQGGAIALDLVYHILVRAQHVTVMCVESIYLVFMYAHACSPVVGDSRTWVDCFTRAADTVWGYM